MARNPNSEKTSLPISRKLMEACKVEAYKLSGKIPTGPEAVELVLKKALGIK